MKDALKKKVDFAINLLRNVEKMAAKVNQPVEICYSGGKDSDVILELAKMSGINYRAIYKNTTIDPPGTIKHVMDKGVEIMRPKCNFLQLVKKNGFPTRLYRHCCRILKEYKVLDYAVVGVRREESWKRAERYHEPEQCKAYSKKEKVRQYFPILEWTMQDVVEFIEERNITCAPVYYNEDGEFYPERRLGCMCCPLTGRKRRIEAFKEHPNMIKIWLRGGQKYLEDHPDSKNVKRFKNVYNWLVYDIFCDNYSEYVERFGPTLFDDGVDCKEFLGNFFGLKL